MIDELIERVEKGEGADRTVDGDIAEMFNPDRFKPEFIRGQARRYTTSLDAVERLIEEKMPGVFGVVDLGALPVDQPLYGARLFSADWDPWKNVAANAASPARALLAAFLRAHKEQHDGR